MGKKKDRGENIMEKVKLAETKIENLRSFNWIEYFKYNNMHLLKLEITTILNTKIKSIL